MTMILAIDPGPKESAYVRWNGEKILAHATLENSLMLSVIQGNPMHEIVIEWIVGYGMTVGSETFDTCRWVGRFEQASGGAHLITRKQIKQCLCDSTQAKDSHIRQALIDRLGAPGTRKEPGPTFGIVGDQWSALAVAVTWWDQHREAK